VCLTAYAIPVPSSHSTAMPRDRNWIEFSESGRSRELPGTTAPLGARQPLPRPATPMSSWCCWCPNGIGKGKGSELDWICRAEEQSGRAEGITLQRKRKEDSNEECSRQVNGLRYGSLSPAGFPENSNFTRLYLLLECKTNPSKKKFAFLGKIINSDAPENNILNKILCMCCSCRMTGH